jgi:hypothetical protein
VNFTGDGGHQDADFLLRRVDAHAKPVGRSFSRRLAGPGWALCTACSIRRHAILAVVGVRAIADVVASQCRGHRAFSRPSLCGLAGAARATLSSASTLARTVATEIVAADFEIAAIVTCHVRAKVFAVDWEGRGRAARPDVVRCTLAELLVRLAMVSVAPTAEERG